VQFFPEAKVFEAEVKSNRTSKHIQKAGYNNREELELEFESYKEKQASELKQLKEWLESKKK
jgi:hypothetical protein